jgi:hypothetical protein
MKNNNKNMMNIKRPRLTINSVENNYSDLIKHLNDNDMLACQFKEDGVTVYIEKLDSIYDCIMVNPHNYKINGVTAWQMKNDDLLKMYNELFSSIEYELFVVQKGSLIRIREIFEGVTEALMCLRTGKNYGDYRIRKLD